jgi:predicted solute-binding protein
MSRPTLAYRRELVTLPIVSALEERGWAARAAADPAAELLAETADIVLTPALDYARNVGVVDFALVPGVGIVCEGVSGLVTLLFNRGLTGLNRIATREPEGAEALVARIILAEKHGLDPQLVGARPDAPLNAMLSSADAALLVGDEAVMGPHEGSLFDISDEWQDLTESPFPYMLAWGRTGEVDELALDALRAACEEAPRLLPVLAAGHGDGGSALAGSVVSGAVRYELRPTDLIGLDTLFRLAFYHGVVTDVASIKYLPDGEPADIPDLSSE